MTKLSTPSDCNYYGLSSQAWLDHHSRSLGFFIDGKLVVPADRPSRSLTDCKGERRQKHFFSFITFLTHVTITVTINNTCVCC